MLYQENGVTRRDENGGESGSAPCPVRMLNRFAGDHMKRTYMTIVSLAAGLLITSGGCSRKSDPATDKYDEAEMNAAIAKARETFGEFKERLLKPQPGDSGFAIKVKITDENGTEHFWLDKIKVKGESFTGAVNNNPEVVRIVRLGQAYTFGFEDVSDWMYMSGGVMQGNHTLRVLLKSMPRKEAEAVKKKFGWQ